MQQVAGNGCREGQAAKGKESSHQNYLPAEVVQKAQG